MRRFKYIISIIGGLFFLAYQGYAQSTYHVEFNNYRTVRDGSIYGFGIGHSYASFAITGGVSFVRLGNLKYGRGWGVDGGTTSYGLGLNLSFQRFLTDLTRTGLYVGIRSDIQFLNNKHHYILSGDTWKTTSKDLLILGQVGYSLNFYKKYFVKFHFSGGVSFENYDFKKSLYLIGIQFSTDLE